MISGECATLCIAFLKWPASRLPPDYPHPRPYRPPPSSTRELTITRVHNYQIADARFNDGPSALSTKPRLIKPLLVRVALSGAVHLISPHCELRDSYVDCGTRNICSDKCNSSYMIESKITNSEVF